MSLGENIKLLRKRRRLDQYQLADLLKVSQSSVCDWENGVSSPRVKRLTEIARVLGVQVSRLVR